MLLDLLELLIDLPSLLVDVASRRRVSCPDCGHRLRYVGRGKAEGKVQCVLCEKTWRMTKNRWLGRALARDEPPAKFKKR